MPNIAGRFYIKLTDAGNLIGEYSNDQTKSSQPESALRDYPTQTRSFIGDYTSTWFETNSGSSVAAKLTITSKGSSFDLFTLTWKELTNMKPIYRGEAMLCDGRLVGSYWSADHES